MLDEKGYFYIVDAILVVFLILTVVLIVNATISIPSPDYAYDYQKIRDAQDIMEVLSGKVNFTEKTFLDDITEILRKNENSKESVKEVSKICKTKFKDFNLENYRFTESNFLNSKVLASSGDYSNANKVSVATRNCGNYSYTLFVW